jgi:lipopolysaccharide transport system ATP-binding protein
VSAAQPAIRVERVDKTYRLYSRASDRLLDFVASAARRAARLDWRPRHAEFHALQKVSLEVRRGETVGIIGRNGSGKSTLLQIIAGTLQASAGTVAVDGRLAALLELGSGFHPEFSGRDNVMLNAHLLGLTQAQAVARFDAIAAFADIGDFMEQPLRTYSSGMVVRLAFAVIAHVDAAILVIDEALAVGDAMFTQKCMRFLRGFMQHGTVLFVSHDIESVKALCGRVVWLDGGRVRMDGPTLEVCQSYLDALFAPLGEVPAAPAQHQPRQTPVFEPPYRDARQDWLNASGLRNDIHLPRFDPAGAGFGAGGASIRDVRLLDAQGRALTWSVGGEMVELVVAVECHQALASPIIGFMVKDKTGQALFGDNTWLRPGMPPAAAGPGQWLQARFAFQMPRLPAGDYSTVVAVVDGTQDDCVHHHWLHDALPLHSSSSSVASGLIGIPMQRVELHAVSPAEAAAPRVAEARSAKS